MKRMMSLALAFILACSLCACDKPKEKEPIASGTDEIPTATEEISNEPKEDVPETSGEETRDIVVNEDSASVPLDTEAAQQAAFDYYKGTVFEVSSMTQIEPLDGWDGDIMFRVSCTKGGEPQVDRNIALSSQDGAWIVVGEGY